MPAVNKVGTQLLVSPHTLDRARALAIVRHEQVAEIWRAALDDGGLNGLERQHAEGISRLHAALNVQKVDKTRAFAAMLRGKLRVEDLYVTDGSRPKRFFPVPLDGGEGGRK